MRWLANVARRADLPNVNTLKIPSGLTQAEAWAAVSGHCAVEQTALAQHVARQFHLAVADLSVSDTKALKLVPEAVARHLNVLPLREDDHSLLVATSDPTDREAEKVLRSASGRIPLFAVAPPGPVRDAIDTRYSSRCTGDESYHEAHAESSGETSAAPYILLVDDDPVIRTMARTLLDARGFRVSEAGDGVTALELLAVTGPFDVMVLDLNMPKLGGFDLLRRVRASASWKSLPVLVFTESEAGEAESLIIAEGADDYIRKPLDPPRFVARVIAALRRAGANHGHRATDRIWYTPA